MIRAIIFDFDGLLVNSERLIEISYVEFLGNYGVKFDIRLMREMMGRPAVENMKMLKKKYELPGTPEELLVERRSISKELFDGRLALMDGVNELLERTKNWKVLRAIASGATREYILPALKRLGIEEYFTVVVATEDLVKSKGKPDPEIFLLAAEKLGVNPEECIVLEDSPLGVEASKAAGMRVIFIPDARFTDPDHDKADVIMESLHELTDELMKVLAAK